MTAQVATPRAGRGRPEPHPVDPRTPRRQSRPKPPPRQQPKPPPKPQKGVLADDLVALRDALPPFTPDQVAVVGRIAARIDARIAAQEAAAAA